MKAIIVEGSMEEITAILSAQEADKALVSVEAIRASFSQTSPASPDMDGKHPLALSVKEAAELLGICTDEVRRLARTDGFPAYRIGNRIKIHYDGLLAWVAAQARQ